MARRLLIILALLPVLAWGANPTVLRMVDLRWISGQPELETWLGSLQGTLNRVATEAPVFLVRDDTDAALADGLIRAYGLKREVFTPGALLETAKAGLTGQVLYNPATPGARNRALSLAALAKGQVIATDRDLGLPTVHDLRAAAEIPLPPSADSTVLLAPPSGHLLADFAAIHRLRLTEADDATEALFKRLGMGIRLLGSAGTPEADAAVRRRLAQARGMKDYTVIPISQVANLSCYARFTALRPALQYREEASIKPGTELLVLIYEGTGSLDDIATRILPLFDDPALANLPVGIEAPAGLGDVAPALYQALLTRQFSSATEFLAAPMTGAVPPGAAAMDFTGVALAGEDGAWPAVADVADAAKGPWKRAFLHKGVGAMPLYKGKVPELFPFYASYGRAANVEQLRQALKTMEGPVQVLYLDPAGLPPSTIASMLREITYSRSLVTPSQAYRAREFTAVFELLTAQKAKGVHRPDRLKPTLTAAAPTTTLGAITAAAPIPIRVQVGGAAGVHTARLIYRDPRGRVLAADLDDDGAGTLSATLPPMLAGGTAVIRARVVENGGLGITLSPPLTLPVVGADTDNDTLDDAREAYIGSNPRSQDTDGDGLPDPMDARPTVPDRDVLPLIATVRPPADAALLADAGDSTADADGRVVPAKGRVTYRIPMQDIAATGAALRLVTTGAGTVSLNGGEAVRLLSATGRGAVTDVPLGAKIATTTTVVLTAGDAPLRLVSLGLVTNPEGPYIIGLRLDPAVPPAGMPIRVEATLYDPDGVKGVAVRYGASLDAMAIVNLKPVEGSGNTVFAGEIPAQLGGDPLLYGLLAKDAQEHVTASPYSVVPVGKNRKFSVALIAGRDLDGNWEPRALWGGIGHALEDGVATDQRKAPLRPGRYTAWLLAMPRQRGINVRIGDKLRAAVPAGGADGWYKLGAFTLTDIGERVEITLTPIGQTGFTAYGMLVLTQDGAFTPPLAHAGIDWYNSLTLTGIGEGQVFTGDRISIGAAVTGNIDLIDITAKLTRSSMTLPEQRFEKDINGNYILRTAGLPAGSYVVTATGYRVVPGTKPVELVKATVNVTVQK